MEWIKNLLEKHTKEGKLDTEAFMAEVKTEFPNHISKHHPFAPISAPAP